MTDFTSTIKHWHKLAKKGDALAQFILCAIYYEGIGVPQDYVKAAKWLHEAARQGIAEAQFNLGTVYYEGKGVHQNYAEAAKWFQKAAERGVAEAQFNLGILYTEGVGVPQDSTEAVKWLQKAAEQGIVEAQFDLGVAYAKGEGVSQNDVKAFYWFRQAAEQGFAEAQVNLGVAYEKGQGVVLDYTEARQWYQTAAEQEVPVAWLNLGNLYSKGLGTPQNYQKALECYTQVMSPQASMGLSLPLAGSESLALLASAEATVLHAQRDLEQSLRIIVQQGSASLHLLESYLTHPHALETIYALQRLFKTFKLLTLDGEELAGESSILGILTNAIKEALTFLLTSLNLSHMSQYYLNYATRHQPINPTKMQNQWQTEFKALTASAHQLDDFSEWVSERFCPLEYDIQDDTFRFNNYYESLLLVVMTEMITNAFKYYHASTEQLPIRLIWRCEKGYGYFICENPKTADQPNQAPQTGHFFLHLLARKIAGNFLVNSTAHSYQSTFAFPCKRL